MPKKYEYDGYDAYPVMLSSFMYLITHPLYGWFLYLVIGVGVTREIINYTGISIKPGEQLQVTDIPKKPASFNLVEGGSIFQTVQDKKMSNTWESPDAIRVDGRFLGAFFDTRFQIWKQKGENRLVIYSYEAKQARPWEVSGGLFDLDSYRQSKK
jgi:hypothetical protein